MDDGIDLTEEQMAANAEAARAAAPKKRAKTKTVPAGAAHISSTTRSRAERRADAKAASMPARAAKEAAKPRVKAARATTVAEAIKNHPISAEIDSRRKPKAKASKPDPVETAPKPPKGKPKPATAAPVAKPEPVSEKAELQALDAPSPRQDKRGAVIALLRRPEGASAPEAGEAIGWQVHSVRALITATIGRKLGHKVVARKEEGRGTVYRIAPEEAV